jgi:hypothetical protein
MACCLYGQKKPLDHSVYDNWQNIGARKISNDGKWIAYSVDVQEGNPNLFLYSVKNKTQRNLRDNKNGFYRMIPDLLFSRSVLCIKI